jgi:hypothetical protein
MQLYYQTQLGESALSGARQALALRFFHGSIKALFKPLRRYYGAITALLRRDCSLQTVVVTEQDADEGAEQGKCGKRSIKRRGREEKHFSYIYDCCFCACFYGCVCQCVSVCARLCLRLCLLVFLCVSFPPFLSRSLSPSLSLSVHRSKADAASRMQQMLRGGRGGSHGLGGGAGKDEEPSLEQLLKMAQLAGSLGRQFTCFASTEVQILTLKALHSLQEMEGGGGQREGGEGGGRGGAMMICCSSRIYCIGRCVRRCVCVCLFVSMCMCEGVAGG